MKKILFAVFVLCLCWCAASDYVAKANQAPIPSFTFSPHGGAVVNGTITFDASGSSDSDGSITTYVWDFGDGSEQETSNSTTTHAYESAGTYHPNLDLIDNEGKESDLSFSETIIIHPLHEEFPLDSGWTSSGEIIDYGYMFDISIVKTPEGYRMYVGDGQISTHNVVSYNSSDGINWTLEEGYRLYGLGFMVYVMNLSNGSYRMYYTGGDTIEHPDTTAGCSAIRSAISENGINFTLEDGDRLTYNPANTYENGGIRASRILELPDGSYRMYYHALEDIGDASYWRILSATSDDGITWTREEGVRISIGDMCHASTSMHNIAPVIDSTGTYHLFVTGTVCTTAQTIEEGNAGIFDMTSSNGVNYTIPSTPVVSEYYTPDHRVGPHDPFAVQNGNDTRLYFYAADGPTVIEESGIYLITKQSSCALTGDSAPCGEISLTEVIDHITAWTQGTAQLSDVIALITAWAGG